MASSGRSQAVRPPLPVPGVMQVAAGLGDA